MKKILIALLVLGLTYSCTCTHLQWKYTKKEINYFSLHPYEGLTQQEKDSMMILIDYWWEMYDNCENTTQPEIDSIETELMQFTEI